MDHRLDLIALVAAQHYRLLKSIVNSSSVFRLPTKDEAVLADYLMDTLERLAGKRLSDYCRTKFQNGWMTRDLRSYKIKFVLTNLRNHLKDSILKKELSERLLDITEKAEQMAGCTTDNKRRNKKALEEREQYLRDKKEAKEHEKLKNGIQMDLFEYAESSNSSDCNLNPVTDSTEEAQDDIDLVVSLKKRDKKENNISYEKIEIPVRKKKSRAEKKYEKLEQEILLSEYGREDDEDRENTEDTENYEYGTHYGDVNSTYGCDDGDNW